MNAFMTVITVLMIAIGFFLIGTGIGSLIEERNTHVEIFDYDNMTEARFFSRECIKSGGRLSVRDLRHIGVEITCTGAKNE